MEKSLTGLSEQQRRQFEETQKMFARLFVELVLGRRGGSSVAGELLSQSKIGEEGTSERIDAAVKLAIKDKLEKGETDQSKFKNMEMLVFKGENLDFWLFQVVRFFQIHKFYEFEKTHCCCHQF